MDDPTPTSAPGDGSGVRAALDGLLARPGALFRAGFYLALGVLVAYGVWTLIGSLRGILIVLVVALFVALGLQPVIEWLIRRGLPRPAAAGLVTGGLLASVVLGLWAVVPLVAEQVATFAQDAPAQFEQLRRNPVIAQLDAQFGVLDRIGPALASGQWVEGAFGGFAAAGAAAANLVGSTGLATVLMLFFTFSAPSIKTAIYELAPASRRPRVRYLANEIFQRMGDYLLSMLLVVSLWGVGTFIVLMAVGLGRFALALALLTMVLTAIPAVGSFVAMAVCTLIALTASPGVALVVLAYFLIYQQVDAYLVQPRLFARSLKVPPALVILGVACGMALLGVLGALLAIPTVASLLLLYREVLVPKLDAA
nr:AI-2E family transporter [Propionibacterium sp.]